MSFCQADVQEFGSIHCFIELAVVMRVLHFLMSGRKNYPCQKAVCRRQMVIHLEQTNQDFRIHFSGHKQLYEALCSLYLSFALRNPVAVDIICRSKKQACCVDRNPALPQGVDCSLVKRLIAGLDALLYSPFLKKCCTNSDCHDQSVDPYRPPSCIGGRLSGVCCLLCGNQHGGIDYSVRSQVLLPLLSETVAIKGAA